MSNLVFVKSKNLKDEPYTTSKVISECGGQEHESVVKLIITYQKELKEFGKLILVKEEFSDLKSGNPKKGGRPSKIYKLNEEQATFLITLMRNTLQVVKFKKDLVKEFFEIKKELNQRRAEREVELNARKNLTDQIKVILGNDQVEYIKYTQLAYRVLFNKTAAQLKVEYGAKKSESPKDFMDSESVRKIHQVEYMILTLLGIGFTYKQIENELNNKFNKDIAA